jgi:PKD repeat protein
VNWWGNAPLAVTVGWSNAVVDWDKTGVIDWGDGQTGSITSSPSSTSHNYAAAGTYTVTVTDFEGTSAEVTVVVGDATATPTVSKPSPSIFCNADSGVHTVTVNGTGFDGAQRVFLDDRPVATTIGANPSTQCTIQVNVQPGGQRTLYVENGTGIRSAKAFLTCGATCPSAPLDIRWVGDNGTANSVNLSIFNATTGESQIDWGDGVVESAWNSGNNVQAGHTYAAPGTYTVTFTEGTAAARQASVTVKAGALVQLSGTTPYQLNLTDPPTTVTFTGVGFDGAQTIYVDNAAMATTYGTDPTIECSTVVDPSQYATTDSGWVWVQNSNGVRSGQSWFTFA